MPTSQARVLTHLPLLRLSEESTAFASGLLRRVPFEEFDDHTLGAFTDERRAYESTAPVFYDRTPEPERSVAPYAAVAALLLASPGRTLPRADLSVEIVLDATGKSVSTSQGDADLELLFHARAAGPFADADELERARTLLPVVMALEGEPDAALYALCASQEPSMDADERLVARAVALEALLLPEISDGLRATFSRRLSILLGEEGTGPVADLADAVYRGRTSAVHQLEERSGDALDESAALLLARALVAVHARLGGAHATPEAMAALREELDVPPSGPPAPVAEAALLEVRAVSEGLSRLVVDRRSLPSSASPDQPDAEGWAAVVFAPLPGLQTTWLPETFPLTSLTGNQVLGLEDPDVRRDFVAQRALTQYACIAIACPGEPSGDRRDVEPVVAAARPFVADAVAALRLAGFSGFVDPELMGDFALSGSCRYRLGTIYRQTALLGEPSAETVTPDDAERVLRPWRLLLAYRAGATSEAVDEVLHLYLRAHDQVTLSSVIRAQLLFGCLELMLGRLPREGYGVLEAIATDATDPAQAAATAWLRDHGRKVRNAVAHGYWDPREEGPSGSEVLPQLTIAVGLAIEAYIASWLQAGRKGDPQDVLGRALKRGAAPVEASEPTDTLVDAARGRRYGALDAAALLRQVAAAEEAGDTEAQRRLLLRAVQLGDAGAMVLLAQLERQADRIEEARALLERAAEAGREDAMNSLGVLSRRAGDLDGARGWYRRSAEAGSVGAVFNWALMEEDEGNLDTAREMYGVAADAGMPPAAHNLGLMLLAAGDRAGAKKRWEQAAELGHPAALGCLGGLAQQEGDLVAARELWTRAAAAGDATAAAALEALPPPE